MNPIPDQVAGFELNFAGQKARTTDGCSDRKFSWPHESWDQREVQLSGPSWVDPQDRHIAGSGLEACHGLSRGRICDRQALNTEACPMCANEVDWPTLQLTGYCILTVLREEHRHPNFADSHEVRNPRVGGLLRIGDACQRSGERSAVCAPVAMTCRKMATSPDFSSSPRCVGTP
jgi:hypothetical protein